MTDIEQAQDENIVSFGDAASATNYLVVDESEPLSDDDVDEEFELNFRKAMAK